MRTRVDSPVAEGVYRFILGCFNFHEYSEDLDAPGERMKDYQRKGAGLIADIVKLYKGQLSLNEDEPAVNGVAALYNWKYKWDDRLRVQDPGVLDADFVSLAQILEIGDLPRILRSRGLSVSEVQALSTVDCGLYFEERFGLAGMDDEVTRAYTGRGDWPVQARKRYRGPILQQYEVNDLHAALSDEREERGLNPRFGPICSSRWAGLFADQSRWREPGSPLPHPERQVDTVFMAVHTDHVGGKRVEQWEVLAGAVAAQLYLNVHTDFEIVIYNRGKKPGAPVVPRHYFVSRGRVKTLLFPNMWHF